MKSYNLIFLAGLFVNLERIVMSFFYHLHLAISALPPLVLFVVTGQGDATPSPVIRVINFEYSYSSVNSLTPNRPTDNEYNQHGLHIETDQINNSLINQNLHLSKFILTVISKSQPYAGKFIFTGNCCRRK